MELPKSLIDRLVRRYPSLTAIEVRDIIVSQFDFVENRIRNNDPKPILLHRLGSFTSSIKRRARIEKAANENKAKKEAKELKQQSNSEADGSKT